MSKLFSDHVEAGFSCIPIRMDGSKGPAVDSWKQYQSEPPSVEQAAQWDAEQKAIAVICGAVSGNLELIDIDEPALSRPYLAAVKQDAPDLFRRLTLHRTPRRNESGQAGCHVLYRCAAATIPGNTKLAMSEPEPDIGDDGQPVLNPQTGEQNMKPRCLIETRGTGGYFVTVGSDPHVHLAKRPYEHAHGSPLLAVENISPAERDFLWRLARTFDRSISESHRDPHPEGYVRGDRRPGDEYAQATSWADVLAPAGWTKAGESAGIARWRRPGKSKGWSATTGVLSQQGQELFCVFSTNAHPFPGPSAGQICSTHSKFDAYALLHHEGDHRAAAAALASQGYGDPPKKQQREQRLVKIKTLEQFEVELVEQVCSGVGQTRSTGIELLDYALAGGYEQSEIILIGGPTSHGKTVLGLQLARNETNQGRNVILVTEEMSGLRLAERRMQTGIFLPRDDWPAVKSKVLAEIHSHWANRGAIFVLEFCVQMDTVEHMVEQVLSEFECGMLVLDYAQEIQGKFKDSTERVRDTSTRFATLARRHGMAGVLLAQLNRQGAREMDIMSFKDTSQLEQDADIALLVEWLAKTNPDHPNPREYRVRVEKNRNRGVRQREVMLEFHPELQEIRSPKEEETREWST